MKYPAVHRTEFLFQRIEIQRILSEHISEGSMIFDSEMKNIVIDEDTLRSRLTIVHFHETLTCDLLCGSQRDLFITTNLCTNDPETPSERSYFIFAVRLISAHPSRSLQIKNNPVISHLHLKQVSSIENGPFTLCVVY